MKFLDDTHLDTTRSVGLSGRVIGPSQKRPLPENTQNSQETDIYPTDGIRTRNPSKRAAADPRLRPRELWERPFLQTTVRICVEKRKTN